jgi:hypothetical protein
MYQTEDREQEKTPLARSPSPHQRCLEVSTIQWSLWNRASDNFSPWEGREQEQLAQGDCEMLAVTWCNW